MKFKELKLTFAALFALVGVVYGQSERPVMESAVTPKEVMIGDPFTITIDVHSDIMQHIAFPEYELAEQDLIERVEEPRIDTIEVSGRRVHLRKSFVMRSFDEGRYNLGRTAVFYMDKNVADTLYSDDSLRLEVLTYQIDSTSRPIFDIKPQRELPFKFAEISGYVKWGLVLLLILLVVGYIVIRVMAHYGKSIGGLFKPAPPVPPHVAAIAALEDLHNQKLWQSDKQKLYYSTLTDILRTYISGRYSIAAMEMTTDEIIDAIKELDMPRKCAMDLQSLLRDADLVKFAKAAHDAEQNEGYYTKSYNFVEETKVVEEESAEEGEENLKIS